MGFSWDSSKGTEETEENNRLLGAGKEAKATSGIVLHPPGSGVSRTGVSINEKLQKAQARPK